MPKNNGTGSGASRTRKPNALPEPYHPQTDQHELPTQVLLRQVWMRLRRSWIALRYQANRYSFGMLQTNNRLKVIVLGGSFYLASQLQGPSMGPMTGTSINEGEPQPVALELGREAGGKPIPKVNNWGTKNEAAPVSSKYMNAEMVEEYVGRFSNIAITEMQKYGVPASISLAQGLIESRAGHSKLAQRNNNHFGIKCFSRHCKKGHCSNFTDDSHKDFFRAFKNPWDSWREHSRMISTGRYAKLKKHGRDYRAWAYGLKSVGYATDRTYAEKLIGIIEAYKLYKYDR